MFWACRSKVMIKDIISLLLESGGEDLSDHCQASPPTNNGQASNPPAAAASISIHGGHSISSPIKREDSDEQHRMHIYLPPPKYLKEYKR